MIVRDETENLQALLPRIAPLVEELVVVDTGSVDDSRNVARNAGGSVYDFPWCDSFAAARNASLEHATQDWIWWLDADDRIAESSIEALRALLARLGSQDAAYSMRVLCPASDGGPFLQLRHPRVFRRDSRLRWRYRVHEQIAPALEAASVPIVDTDIAITHTGYLCEKLVERKLARNLRLLDIELAENPLDPTLLFNRARTLIELRRGAEALVAMTYLSATSDDFGRELAIMRTQAYSLEHAFDDALESVREGVARHPADSHLHFLEAHVLAVLGRQNEAECILRSMFLLPQEHGRFTQVDETVAQFRARFLLARVLLAQGRAHEALQHARFVIEDRPTFAPAWVTAAAALRLTNQDCLYSSLLRRIPQLPHASIVRAAIESLAAECLEDGDLVRLEKVLADARSTSSMAALAFYRVRAVQGASTAERSRMLEALLAADQWCIEAWSERQNPRVFRNEPACSYSTLGIGVGEVRHVRQAKPV